MLLKFFKPFVVAGFIGISKGLKKSGTPVGYSRKTKLKIT
jgi:hypothetical protein